MVILSSIRFKSLLFYLPIIGGLAFFLQELFLVPFLYGWFIAVNGIVFIAMGKDKIASKMGLPRIPELTLLTLGLLGGWPGLFLARFLFNHKRTKDSFVLMMFVLFFSELLLAAYFLAGHEPAEPRGQTTERTEQTAP